MDKVSREIIKSYNLTVQEVIISNVCNCLAFLEKDGVLKIGYKNEYRSIDLVKNLVIVPEVYEHGLVHKKYFYVIIERGRAPSIFSRRSS